KADIYEGGHRVPFLARWPKGIKAGQKTNALTCLTDLYDTMRDITGQKKIEQGGEDSFSLLPAFKGKPKTTRSTLISHSIGGSFSIRERDWKLCLSAGSGGWSAPRENDAKKQGLPFIQLFNLNQDKNEKTNLQAKNKAKVKELIEVLDKEVRNGRSSSGKKVPNDREVSYLPKGFTIPKSN
ncbi:MAG: arylsulfatase, partial [Opitutae bacterium]|nr:arylsulfatase [Opitutae bacterium]